MTSPDILTAAKEGLRLAEKATKGPWVELPEPYAAGIKSSLGALICALGPTATKDEFLANRDLIAHCGTYHADICRELLRLHEERERIAQLVSTMAETVRMRRFGPTGNARAEFLKSRGWTPIPFTPNGAHEEFVAKSSHPYQKWEKPGYERVVTAKALKLECIKDTDAVVSAALAQTGEENL